MGPGGSVKQLDPTDLDLWQQARSGNRDAFVALAQRHAAGLHRLAYHMTGHLSDSQDLVQETLLAAYQSLERFRGQASVRTWLCRILTLQVAQHWRRQSYRRTRSLEQPVEGQGDAAMAVDSDSTAASDARLDLHELLGQLPMEFRQAILLREIEGFSYDEIARMLGVPRGTVESRIFRARQRLRELARGQSMGEW